MKILRWRLSNWWLLVLVPIAIISVPLLLFGLIVGGHVVGGIVGPPAIWNRPSKLPARADLAGSYRESKRHWQGHTATTPASLTLDSDGTMTVSNLPDSNGETDCILSGKGRWSGPDEHSGVVLFLQQNDNSATCKTGGYGSFEIAGRSTPNTLYWVLGDPDSGEGVWLQRTK
jgi:hypothetical protein